VTGAVASSSSKLSVLFLTTVLPGERRVGGEIVSAQVIETMRSLGHDLRILGYARLGYTVRDGEVAVEMRPIETRDASLWAVRWFAQAILGGNAYSVQKFAGSAYRVALERALSERTWDRIVIDHAQMGWLVPQLDRHGPIIHISHNCEGLLYAEQAEEGNALRRAVFSREARLMQEMEIRLARTARSVWTLTQAQTQAFREMGASSVTLLPVPPMPLPKELRLREPDCDVALLGTWSWGPNRAGLDWFCREVAPLVPDLRIRVGGSGAEDLRGRFSNIEILGRVADAADFLAGARVIAVPSVKGDGIQIKTLDAIAIGRPVVATPFALRGIDELPARVRTAESPQAFAVALRDALAKAPDASADNWQVQRRERFRNALRDALA